MSPREDHEPDQDSDLSRIPALDPALSSWLAPLVGEVSVVRSLVGGITGQMLQLRRAGGGADIVVRRWPAGRDRARSNDPSGDSLWQQGMVRREVAGLEALQGAGLPAPALIAADPDGSASGRPTTVTTFLPGRVELAPPDLRVWVRGLAEMLARIHAVPPPELAACELWASSDLRWLEGDHDSSTGPSGPHSPEPRLGPLDDGLARAAQELAARPADPALVVLSHGDYQHFNVLWRGGSISAVVDWPTVGLADRGLDMGHCRLNLAVLFSADAAMWFLDDYEQFAGAQVDPAADLQRLLNFGPNWPEFIPLQVAGRTPVDGPGMAGRVRETIERTLRRAG